MLMKLQNGIHLSLLNCITCGFGMTHPFPLGVSDLDPSTWFTPLQPSCVRRSVLALQTDLITLEEKFNKCSEHLAKGETVDFDKEWPSSQLEIMRNHRCI